MAAAPGPRKRIVGLDAARGVALFGMILVNVGPVEAESVFQRLYLLPLGRASILFVVVAGTGMGLFLRSRSAGPRWAVLSWRAALLFAGGLLLQSFTESVQVILPLYGMLFLLGPLLWRMSTRTLVAAAAAITVAGPAMIVSHAAAQPASHYQAPAALGASLGELAHSLLLSGPYPLVTWLVPFLVGLALARLNLTDRRVLRSLGIWGAASAVAGFVLSAVATRLLGEAAEAGPGRLLTGVAHGQMPLWLVSSVGGAAFAIAVCVAVGNLRPAAVRWLAYCGQLALTYYVAHIIVLTLIEPTGGFTFAQGVLTTAMMSLSAVVIAVAWGPTRRAGPLEWLLRARWLTPAHPPRTGPSVDGTS